MNSSGLRLLSLCSELGLTITNTFFQLRNMHKTSWMHPRSKHRHLIDYVIVRRCELRDVLLTRAMRGAECSTDHRLICSALQLNVRLPARRQKPKHRLNVSAARDPAIKNELRRTIANSLPSDPPTAPLDTVAALTAEWQAVALGHLERHHQDWFDDKSAAHDALLRNPSSSALRERFSSLRAKAVQIQGFADANDMQCFFEATKAIYGPTQCSLQPVRSKDGVLIKDKASILDRWAEHFLNKINTIDPTILNELPTVPVLSELDIPPSFVNMKKAILSLKNNKAVGPDNIAAEVLKYGGYALNCRLHYFILDCWSARCLPQQWKDANIVLTKISPVLIFDLQYADDAAFLSHTPDGLQRSLDVISETYHRAGLIVNTKKTEVLPSVPPAGAPILTISGTQLKNIGIFTYLGTNLTCVQRCLNLASSTFGRLSDRVFTNRNLKIHTKAAVYNAVVISTLLYGCKAWVPYRRHVKLLESFHTRRLQQILCLRWWDKVTHTDIRRRAGIASVESMLLHRQLRWLGHIIRMPANRLPRQVLYGQLSQGPRSAGGQKKRYKDHVKATLKCSNIPFSNLESLAADRDTWRSTCADAMS
ncbi:Craniofacial development protein 2 [Merluccius polli]|uniref:Craniofacial development protein 2 n=1 Tax=Merluccius polli TaxID=89951 RepID=A0AA47M818_MERPO|nr:Craniofacial development protein 2 [Merluccius polli]